MRPSTASCAREHREDPLEEQKAEDDTSLKAKAALINFWIDSKRIACSTPPAHAALGPAVAAAYGWTDYSAAMTDNEILARLLALNHVRSAQA